MRPASDIAEGAPNAAPAVYWEPRVNSFVATVPPGGFKVTRREDLALVTLRGSCVAACICDAEAGIGVRNHFLCPTTAVPPPAPPPTPPATESTPWRC